jgi:hypothetical protein
MSESVMSRVMCGTYPGSFNIQTTLMGIFNNSAFVFAEFNDAVDRFMVNEDDTMTNGFALMEPSNLERKHNIYYVILHCMLGSICGAIKIYG